nr:Ty3/gypsy retrotransposon protein [Ipomoea batatas]
MAPDGAQTRNRSLEDQVQQIRETHQQTTEELRQALVEQTQATKAIQTAMAELTLHITQQNIIPAASTSTPPVPTTPLRAGPFAINQPSNVQYPRSLRCDISAFDGTNSLDWVFQAEKYFSFWEIADEQRIDIAGFYMVGQALSWFQWMHKNQQLSSWRAFTTALEQRFGPSTYVNHRAALFKLTQKTTMEAYQSEFETKSNQVTDLHPDALLDCFISGLKPAIQNELSILKPTTLSDAIALAKLVEEKLRDSRPLNPRPTTWRPFNTETSHSPALRQVDPTPLLPTPINQNTPNNQLTPRKTTLPIKRLTAAEIQARRAQGLCYNCDERFRPGHRCQTKQFLLLLADEPLVAIDEGENVDCGEETVEDVQVEPEAKFVPEISLHALEGTIGPRTFRLKACAKGREFTLLVDTGSSTQLYPTTTSKIPPFNSGQNHSFSGSGW